MRKILLLVSTLLFSAPLLAGSTQCLSTDTGCAKQQPLDKQLFAALSTDNRHIAHMNKNGDFQIVYGGRDVVRVSAIDEHEPRINIPTMMA
jgi:hypothetical protein